jgi:hypothetical protein
MMDFITILIVITMTLSVITIALFVVSGIKGEDK